MNRIILFFIRLKLRLKKGECFRFANQKNKNNYYYINSDGIFKVIPLKYNEIVRPANVSLTWLLSWKCEIVKR